MKTRNNNKTSRNSKVVSFGANEVLNHQHSPLRELFVSQLKDSYWAEKALEKVIPRLVKYASDPGLIDALEDHLTETQEHAIRLEKIFSLLGSEPKAKKCEAMTGLIAEAERMMRESKRGMGRDAGIILAVQKIEHYEIANYGTLCAIARTLGYDKVTDILEDTLAEEKLADSALTSIAVTAVNKEALEEDYAEE
jgi:ferritin-like metal-binding protein YciE